MVDRRVGVTVEGNLKKIVGGNPRRAEQGECIFGLRK